MGGEREVTSGQGRSQVTSEGGWRREKMMVGFLWVEEEWGQMVGDGWKRVVRRENSRLVIKIGAKLSKK